MSHTLILNVILALFVIAMVVTPLLFAIVTQRGEATVSPTPRRVRRPAAKPSGYRREHGREPIASAVR